VEPHQDLGDPDLEAREIEEGKAAAILAYLPFLCFVPLIKMRENRYALAHGKQGLVLLLIELVAALLLVPRISSLVWQVVLIGCLGAAIAGVWSVLQGGWFKIPIIGDFSEKLKL
jgi:fumarate reductase subunit D